MEYTKDGITLKVESQYEKSVLGFPNEGPTKRRYQDYHNEFNIIVKNDQENRAVFKFYGSSADYEKNKTIMNDDDLKEALCAILEDGLYGLMGFEEFCSELGYDVDSRRAEKIHKLCIEHLNKLKFLGIEDQNMIDMVNELRE
jgi:hypothetical protein